MQDDCDGLKEVKESILELADTLEGMEKRWGEPLSSLLEELRDIRLALESISDNLTLMMHPHHPGAPPRREAAPENP